MSDEMAGVEGDDKRQVCPSQVLRDASGIADCKVELGDVGAWKCREEVRAIQGFAVICPNGRVAKADLCHGATLPGHWADGVSKPSQAI